ncbi:hypothetical protein [Psychrobacter sp. Cmf 22.2]|uniref:hypothetical protein n=1 Tax=Psychrobacter sp. Cmf 22.2 TaxID=1926478 RepID=UPI000946F30A|nr:hypothetical protein [Psychrobacter sp. Cmf 22.2]OLF39063.1 hypothetical protein BTV98_01170 [Psychrobacter sp. Cmf 22.2]
MKAPTLASLKTKSYLHVFPVILFSVLILTACQKSPEPEAANEPQAETTTVQSTPVNDDSDNNDSGAPIDSSQNSVDSTEESKNDVSVSELENDIKTVEVAPNTTAATPNPEQAIKGAQITDVIYKSAAGESLSVTFETSAAGVLNAIVTLPNKSMMTLSAPEGQDNNPTYHSTDGHIQLVTHAGGSSIDLIENNNVKSFDAISADAEVVTE